MVKQKLNSKLIINEMEMRKKDLKRFGVKKIGLFGSFAKGEEHKKSDIDILVTFDNITFDNYTDLLFLLEKIFRRKIDLVIERKLHPSLNYVKKEAKYVRL
jgi:uncharacterized protein